jgi:hypothetical protein
VKIKGDLSRRPPEGTKAYLIAVSSKTGKSKKVSPIGQSFILVSATGYNL